MVGYLLKLAYYDVAIASIGNVSQNAGFEILLGDPHRKIDTPLLKYAVVFYPPVAHNK